MAISQDSIFFALLIFYGKKQPNKKVLLLDLIAFAHEQANSTTLDSGYFFIRLLLPVPGSGLLIYALSPL